jgi:nitroreductase
MPADQMSILDAISKRRSVRSYGPEKLDEAAIRALLNAAVHAPTAMHAEPWAFVVIQNPATLKRISNRAKATWLADPVRHRDMHGLAEPGQATTFLDLLVNPDFSVFYDAGTLIVICAKPAGPFIAADCWLAAENLMLAACGLGLGTCCIGSALAALNMPDLKAELGIPPLLTAMAAIVVGTPSGETPEVPRKAPEILTWIRT